MSFVGWPGLVLDCILACGVGASTVVAAVLVAKVQTEAVDPWSVKCSVRREHPPAGGTAQRRVGLRRVGLRDRLLGAWWQSGHGHVNPCMGALRFRQAQSSAPTIMGPARSASAAAIV